MQRRDFLKLTAESILLFSFYHFLSMTKAWAKTIDPIMSQWLKGIGELAQSVQKGKIQPQLWQKKIEELHRQIPLQDIIRFVDLDQALRQVQYPKEKLGGIVNVPWPQIDGLAPAAEFGHKLFIYRKAASTPPHAHNHLVSAHLILQGEMRVRTFDRIEDLEKSILIRPTRDQIEKKGSTVTMSDAKDNVHWFEGVSDISISFDVPVPHIDENKKYQQKAEAMNQIFLDASLRPRADGLIEAPVIKFADSIKRFG
jgi:hypothetical protein